MVETITITSHQRPRFPVAALKCGVVIVQSFSYRMQYMLSRSAKVLDKFLNFSVSSFRED